MDTKGPTSFLASSLSAFIDKGVTQSLRRCARFEDLRCIGIDTELHHQYSVGRSPFVLASTSRTPPVAMLLLSVVAVSVSRRYRPNVWETVAMRANVQQSDSSHPINWSDDPPQEISAFSQDLLCDAQTANVIFATFS